MDIPVTMMIAMSMGNTSRVTRFVFMLYLLPGVSFYLSGF
jgi:hypothetical protein